MDQKYYGSVSMLMSFNWRALGCTPMTCEACHQCWRLPGADRCIYNGPFYYKNSGAWYHELAEKIKKESYKC